MAKKFNTNVAENWITGDINQMAETPEAAAAEVPAAVKPVEKEIVESPAETVKEEAPVEKKVSAPKEKKTKTEGQPFTIVGKELKTRQTSLLLKGSVYAKLEALAKKNGISVNSCINQILEQVLQ